MDEGSWNVPACACDAEEQTQDSGMRMHEGGQEWGRELRAEGSVCAQQNEWWWENTWTTADVFVISLMFI